MFARCGQFAFVILACMMHPALAAQIIGSQAKATVRGTVVASDGSPVSGAQVWAILRPRGAGGIVGDFFPVNADTQGRFSLPLSPGRYVVRAQAMESGYPNPDFVLSADPTARFPIIAVGLSDISGVVVRLGKKGGVLEGAVSDAKSKTPIPGAEVVLRGPHHPRAVVEVTCDKTGHFLIAVPSKPILISASAPGYKPTRFAEGNPMTLSSGERRKISLELVRP